MHLPGYCAHRIRGTAHLIVDSGAIGDGPLLVLTLGWHGARSVHAKDGAGIDGWNVLTGSQSQHAAGRGALDQPAVRALRPSFLVMGVFYFA